MRILSRDFTTAEKILLLVLLLLLLGLAYYRFVYVEVSDAIATANAQSDALETELADADARVGLLENMQSELVELEAGVLLSRMESYNNAKAEIALLNGVLQDADTYSINFTNVTRQGNQIRRNFSLQFTASSYDAAKEIITSLSRSEYRCLLGDLRYSETLNRDTEAPISNVNVTATFFETMVGGTPDAGLPADSSESK